MLLYNIANCTTIAIITNIITITMGVRYAIVYSKLYTKSWYAINISYKYLVSEYLVFKHLVFKSLWFQYLVSNHFSISVWPCN